MPQPALSKEVANGLNANHVKKVGSLDSTESILIHASVAEYVWALGMLYR
jgi:hypothetical protein